MCVCICTFTYACIHICIFHRSCMYIHVQRAHFYKSSHLSIWHLWYGVAPPQSYRYLNDSMGQTYRIYGDLCFCGVGPMGFVGVYGIAVWDLWGTRCLIYGDLWGCMGIYGDLCFCGVGPMVLQVCTYMI